MFTEVVLTEINANEDGILHFPFISGHWIIIVQHETHVCLNFALELS
jgi:hypothetical protein